jgi:hypothetical protein
MSIIAEKTDRRAIQIIARSLKILDKMPSDVRLSKIDDFEFSLAKNRLKRVVENNEKAFEIKPSQQF